jgi:hypothetical protein
MYSFGCSSEIGGFDEDQELSGDELGPSMSTGPGLDPFFDVEQPGDPDVGGEYYPHFGPAAVIAGEDDLSGEVYSGSNPALIGAEHAAMRQRGARGHKHVGLHLGTGHHAGHGLRSIKG